jgi:hypothetical protein
MTKYRSELKGRRNFDTAPRYNTVDIIVTENTRTARPEVRATCCRFERLIHAKLKQFSDVGLGRIWRHQPIPVQS